MKIILQFSTSTSIGSRLIDWFTWGNYSHVDIVLADGSWFGARSDGVKARAPYPVSKFMRMEVEAPDAVLAIALLQEGKPYDFMAILGFIFKRDWQNDSKWFCSELVAWAFQEGGMHLINAEHLNRVSPRDLMMSPLLKQQH
jgi:uncharacterized protein YycO